MTSYVYLLRLGSISPLALKTKPAVPVGLSYPLVGRSVGVPRVKCQRCIRSESGAAAASAAHCAQQTNALECRTLNAQGDGDFARSCAKGQETAVPRL